jgi:hypothetical protein
MSYTIVKQPDGDVSVGNLNGEYVCLSDSISDYATGGYAIIGGETAQQNNTPNLINCDLWRILTAVPVGGQGGYSPVWNPTTQKVQMFPNNSLSEAAAGTDLSAYSFYLLLLGY